MSKINNTLMDMLRDIKRHQRDRDQLLGVYVNARLNKSLEVYYSCLLDSLSSLKQFNEMSVLKKLNKKK